MWRAAPASWCRATGTLAQAIAEDLSGRRAILDGEIVRPGPDGRPLFYELMRRRGPFCFYAFDLVWLDAIDLRGRPLVERKALLAEWLPPWETAVHYVDHMPSGTEANESIESRRAASRRDRNWPAEAASTDDAVAADESGRGILPSRQLRRSALCK